MYAYPKEVRDRARERWVSGEVSMSGLVREMQIARETLLRWRMEDDWDALRNQAEQEANRREVEELTEKRVTFRRNSLSLWAFLHAQMFLRAKRYTEAQKEMPMDEAIDMAKVLAACETGYQMSLGIDPRLEARAGISSAPRRVLIEYDPQPGVFDDPDPLPFSVDTAGNGSDGNGGHGSNDSDGGGGNGNGLE